MARVYRRDSHRIFFAAVYAVAAAGLVVPAIVVHAAIAVVALVLAERERGQSPAVPRALDGLNAELARRRPSPA